MNYVEEKRIKGANGYVALALLVVVLLASIAAMVAVGIAFENETISGGLFGVLLTLSIIICCVDSMAFAGLRVVNPNEAMVLAVFGKYVGTIYDAGFHYVNPFAMAIYPKAKEAEDKEKTLLASLAKTSSYPGKTPGRKVSTKISTFVNGNQKVNDALGNPIEVSAIVIWKVVNATKAVIDVDNYMEYLSNQTDSTIRNIARLYPYDIITDDESQSDDEMTLRGSASKIAAEMQEELQRKVLSAGIEIEEVKLNQIAYAPEIAAAMLQRQQATAIIAARRKIVDGAVSMVEIALERLKSDGVVDLDEERKAQMVSNLMVVLCSNREASPIVNAGSIY